MGVVTRIAIGIGALVLIAMLGVAYSGFAFLVFDHRSSILELCSGGVALGAGAVLVYTRSRKNTERSLIRFAATHIAMFAWTFFFLVGWDSLGHSKASWTWKQNLCVAAIFAVVWVIRDFRGDQARAKSVTQSSIPPRVI